MSGGRSAAPTTEALARLLDQYRAGLEAETAILQQLAAVAEAQGHGAGRADTEAFTRAADERDRLMQGLVAIEADLRNVRAELTAHRDRARNISGYEEVATMHREAAGLVARIVKVDEESLRALADAELARRSAAAGIERGESTLAAYRKVLTPPAGGATLVDRRG